MIREHTTVSDAVRRYPNLSRLFERVGVDYCCGGNVPIADACAEKGLDAATMVTMINAQLEAPAETGERLDTLSTKDLLDYIVGNHHAYLREELPRLAELTQKVAEGHGEEDPRLSEAARVFAELASELLPPTRRKRSSAPSRRFLRPRRVPDRAPSGRSSPSSRPSMSGWAASLRS
ncbi:MAG: DUF542 domain-containing protein [Spirochaetaceae bacterium]